MDKRSSVGVPDAGDLFHAPAADVEATKTLAAPTDGSWVVAGVIFGFDSTPSASADFTIESPAGSNHHQIPVATAGMQSVDFDPALRFPHEAAVEISLPAGGSGVSGYVGFKAAWVE